ncbi:MAG: hypothetical protein HLUCCA12_10525 [Rhodobacteraceae bacterium HLUCCA12]|nr:MAG: hypothetical protein HLUCCA12_10525 [Rhodobacteraceae bacterium HLUCCA12]
MNRLIRHFGAIAAIFLSVITAPLNAQTIRVTAGEHRGFTRLVLQSARAIDWTLGRSAARARDGSANRRTLPLRIAGDERRIDLRQTFARIPRTRLADLSRTATGLELHLACDCPIRAWTERPGLVVLDIGDRDDSRFAPAVPEASMRPRPAPRGPSAARALPDLARPAGRALAQRWQGAEDTLVGTRHGPRPSPVSQTERSTLTHLLATQIAGALTQGLLDPVRPAPASAPTQDAVSVAPAAAAEGEPRNLRITSVLDRPGGRATTPDDEVTDPCAAAAALDFVLDNAPASFNTAYSASMADWIGEFDEPVPAAAETLIRLYLQHGFGAEARALIEQARHPVAGNDLLLGFADVLEGRQSNSRRWLSRQYRCGGVAAMLAALANAAPGDIRPQADQIASAFSQAPPVIRNRLGGTLVRRLIEAEAIDAARVVADTLRRTPHAPSADTEIAAALLERERGEIARAGDLLQHSAGEDAETVILRLQLALDNGADVPGSVLDNAEALASAQRDTDLGADLMDVAIRLRLAAGAPVAALEAYDRLMRWSGSSALDPATRQRMADAVWQGLARDAPDPALLGFIFNRRDWRDPAHSPRTRAMIAARVLDFGLTEAARPLLDPPQGAEQRHLLAQLHLQDGAPDRALALLNGDQSQTAQTLRARARRRGAGAPGSDQAPTFAPTQAGADPAPDLAQAATDRPLAVPPVPDTAPDAAPAQPRDAQDAVAQTDPARIERGPASAPEAGQLSDGAATAPSGSVQDIAQDPSAIAPEAAVAPPSEAQMASTLPTPRTAEVDPGDMRALTARADAPFPRPAGPDATNTRQRSALLLEESQQLRAALSPLLARAAPEPD